MAARVYTEVLKNFTLRFVRAKATSVPSSWPKETNAFALDSARTPPPLPNSTLSCVYGVAERFAFISGLVAASHGSALARARAEACVKYVREKTGMGRLAEGGSQPVWACIVHFVNSHSSPPFCASTVLRHHFPESSATGDSREALDVSRSASSTTTASAKVPQLGSRVWSVSLGSSDSTPCSQTQPPVIPPVFRDELRMQVSVSDRVNMPNQQEERRLAGRPVAATVELAHVSREQSAVPLAPADLTTSDTSPLSPPPVPSSTAAESVSAAADMMTAEVGPSQALSSTSQTQPDETVRVVGAGLTSLVPGEDFQRASISAIASLQPPPQPQPQPRQLSPPKREPDDDCTPSDTRRSRVLSIVGDREKSVPPHHAEGGGQDRSATTMMTSDRSMKHAIAFAAATVEAAATNHETKVEEAWPDRTGTPKTTPTRAMASAVVGSATAAEAKEENSSEVPVQLGHLNLSTNIDRSRTGQRHARRAGATAVETQGSSVSRLPIEEQNVGGEVQTAAEAADIWDHATTEMEPTEFNPMRMTTRAAKPANGTSPIGDKTESMIRVTFSMCWHSFVLSGGGQGCEWRGIGVEGCRLLRGATWPNQICRGVAAIRRASRPSKRFHSGRLMFVAVRHLGQSGPKQPHTHRRHIHPTRPMAPAFWADYLSSRDLPPQQCYLVYLIRL